MKTLEQDATVHIAIADVILEGFLNMPPDPQGVVIFSHGSGSGRLSPRNNFVFNILQKNGIATLLLDLLTEEEDEQYSNRFDIGKLTLRLIKTTQWIQRQPSCETLPIGYFGASTGAASALRAAAFFGNAIKAVVSRGGRPNLAADVLGQVQAATLLLVGSWDTTVLQLNRGAFALLRCKKELQIIPDADHLFEQPGKLREVADASTAWFVHHFSPKPIDDVQR